MEDRPKGNSMFDKVIKEKEEDLKPLLVTLKDTVLSQLTLANHQDGQNYHIYQKALQKVHEVFNQTTKNETDKGKDVLAVVAAIYEEDNVSQAVKLKMHEILSQYQEKFKISFVNTFEFKK